MKQSVPQGPSHPETVRLMQQAHQTHFAVDPQESKFIICRRRTYYGQEGTFTWDWEESTWRVYLSQAYYRLTKAADVQGGRLLEVLRQQDLERNTLVLFTSGHGEGIAAHRWVTKLMLYEEPLRAPFIVRWPGKIAAGVVDGQRLVSGLDVLPTLCDWAEVYFPRGTGNSLRPLVENPGQEGRSFLISELYPDTEDLKMQCRMLRTRHFKYVAFSPGQSAEMLFGLEVDLGETCNLALDGAWGGELEQHRALLRHWCVPQDNSFSSLVA